MGQRRMIENSSFIIYPSSLLFTLWAFRTVFRTAFLAVVYPGRIERAAYDGVTYTGQVFYPAAAHQYDGVLLEVVAFARDIADHFDPVGHPDFSYFTEGRVGFLRRGRIYAGAYAAPLRAGIERATLTRIFNFLAALPDHLINRRHKCC